MRNKKFLTVETAILISISHKINICALGSTFRKTKTSIPLQNVSMWWWNSMMIAAFICGSGKGWDITFPMLKKKKNILKKYFFL